MRVLVIGDLHGRKPLIKNNNFDCMVVVGDVCDDRDIGPLYKKWFNELGKIKNQEETQQNKEIRDFGKFISSLGISNKKMSQFGKKSLKKGNEILKYLDSYGKPIFMVAGNWDQSNGKTKITDIEKSPYNHYKYFYDLVLGDKINPNLLIGTKNIRNCMFHCHEFEGINFVGYGLSSGPEDFRIGIRSKKLNKIEINKLRNVSRKISDKLSNSFKERKKEKLFTFFITHNVPHNTKLDLITNKKSYAHNKHFGSTTARNFCLKYKPEICVGGHIHECQGKVKLGKTLVVNTGFGPKSTVLVEIDTEKKKIKKVEFVK